MSSTEKNVDVPIPHENPLFRIHLPCETESYTPDEMVDLLGGTTAVLEALRSESNDKLTFTIPKADKTKSTCVLTANREQNKGARLLLKVEKSDEGRVEASIVGVVDTVFSFDELADFTVFESLSLIFAIFVLLISQLSCISSYCSFFWRAHCTFFFLAAHCTYRFVSIRTTRL